MTLIQILENRQKALTVGEVAELLGVSKRKIYEMVADGSLPGFRVGRSIRIDAQEFAGWLRNKKCGIVQDERLNSSERHKDLAPRRKHPPKRSADHFWRKRINCLEVAAAIEKSK